MLRTREAAAEYGRQQQCNRRVRLRAEHIQRNPQHRCRQKLLPRAAQRDRTKQSEIRLRHQRRGTRRQCCRQQPRSRISMQGAAKNRTADACQRNAERPKCHRALPAKQSHPAQHRTNTRSQAGRKPSEARQACPLKDRRLRQGHHAQCDQLRRLRPVTAQEITNARTERR